MPYGSEPSRVARLTLRLIWPFILIVVLQTLLGAGSIFTLSSVRAFVAGESLWSKANKDAIFQLDRYASSGKEEHYRRYLEAIKVPQADKRARVELSKPEPDYDQVLNDLVQGLNHPDDMPAVIWLLRNLGNTVLLRTPLEMWAKGDAYVDEIQQLGAEVRARHQDSEIIDVQTINEWRDRLYALNTAIAPYAYSFSKELGDNSRALLVLLLWLNGMTAILLITIGLMHTRRLVQQRLHDAYALRLERTRAETTLRFIGSGVITTDKIGRVLYMNPAAEALLGEELSTSRARPLNELLHLEPLGVQHETPFLDRVLQHQRYAVEAHPRRLIRPDRSSTPIRIEGSAIDNEGECDGAVIVIHDITREQHFLDQLTWQASHDMLTGLTNRRGFEARLEELLKQYPQPTDPGVVLFADLDQFKVVNDTCGHQAGDALLREVCQMLQRNLRKEDMLARLGGDEFGIILPNCPRDVAIDIAEHLRHSAQKVQVSWGDRTIRTGLSIGLVELTPELNKLQEVQRVGDMACYEAKERGRNNVYIYRPEDEKLLRHQVDMDWMQRLRESLEEDLFVLYAQSIVPLQTPAYEKGLHVELLLRMFNARGELVVPGEFIPAAERFGLMQSIDRWVVKRAFLTLEQRNNAPYCVPVSTCSINLSGSSLSDPQLFDFLHAQMKLHSIDPSTICFEITETSAIAHMAEAIRVIQALRHLGCRFSLDDFGSGMSSFSYLQQLPVDYLKIDGSFVRDMLKDPINHAMVEMINRIGHIMQKQTIAEFAETSDVVEALREMGVDYAQGFSLSHPQAFDVQYPR